jgi:hypothetical protein
MTNRERAKLTSRLRVAAEQAHKKNEGTGSGVWSETAACNNIAASEIERLDKILAAYREARRCALDKRTRARRP